MAKNPQRRGRPVASQQLRAADLLLVLSALAFFFAALFAGYGIYESRASGEPFTAQTLFSCLARLVGGLAVAALFLALSWALRTLDALSRTLDRLRGGLGTPTNPPPPSASTRNSSMVSASPEALRQVRELLEEIRDCTLLNDEQKRERWARVMEHRRKDLSDSVQGFIDHKRFIDASHDLDRFEELYGRDEEIIALRRKYDAARRTAERRDLAEALDTYVSLKANREWDKAMRHAEGILSTYPQSIEIRQWIGQINRDRDQVGAEHRAKLLADVRSGTAEREWRKTLAVGRVLLEQYPDSAEASAVRPQLQTLEYNAEVETRQELEAEIKDLIKERKFADALELAGQVISNYPDSPQAQALQTQLPRLRRRAAEAAGS